MSKPHADFNMIGQWPSYMSETIAYMKDYLDRFHQIKDIMLEYPVTKCTRTKLDEQQREVQHHRAQTSQRIALSKRRQNPNAEWEEENKRPMDIINSESHFNFIMILY